MGSLRQTAIVLALHVSLTVSAVASDRVELSDLDGIWLGMYTYATQSKAPVEFVLTLQADANRCRGRIEEPNTFGNPSTSKLYANVECEVAVGRGPPRLLFKKIYDGTGGQTHGVDYDGEIASDRKGITGSWRIGTHSGRFSLIRQ